MSELELIRCGSGGNRSEIYGNSARQGIVSVMGMIAAHCDQLQEKDTSMKSGPNLNSVLSKISLASRNIQGATD